MMKMMFGLLPAISSAENNRLPAGDFLPVQEVIIMINVTMQMVDIVLLATVIDVPPEYACII
jgi:hypothetical protein